MPTAHVLRNASIQTRNAIDRVHRAEHGGGVTPHHGGDEAARRSARNEGGGDEAVGPGPERPRGSSRTAPSPGRANGAVISTAANA